VIGSCAVELNGGPYVSPAVEVLRDK